MFLNIDPKNEISKTDFENQTFKVINVLDLWIFSHKILWYLDFV